MNPANTTVVVSCYKKSTEWACTLEEKGFNVLRYTKEDSTSVYNVEKNIGGEASTYLKYIMDFYESLPEYTIFLHDEEFSWHHEGSIIHRIEESIGFDGGYKTLNNVYNLPEFYLTCDKDTDKFYKMYLEKYLGPIEKYGEFMGTQIGAAQMVISRSAILAHPYEMYFNFYSWMMCIIPYDIHSQKRPGIFMEYLWALIFGNVKLLDRTLQIAVICDGDGDIGCQARYSYQVIDFFCTGQTGCPIWKNGPIDHEKYKVFIFIHPSIKKINYDHFYTHFLDIHNWSKPYIYGFGKDGMFDRRCIITNVYNWSIDKVTPTLLEESLENSKLLGLG